MELDVLDGLRSPKEAVVPAFDEQEAERSPGKRLRPGRVADHHRIQRPTRHLQQPGLGRVRIAAGAAALRDSNDTDHEWRYHVFCVGKLEDQGRGYQFDTRGTDGTENYFESIVLAAGFEFPDHSEWGDLKKRRLEETPFYFRVAVHEVGHAMKLEHNDDTCGFMATTDAIKQAATHDSGGGAQAQ